MKKFLTLVLALVLALGLTVPAMAFTSDTTNDDSIPYELSIYLVDYEDDDLFGFVTLPESDRGYAKNEIVAAVIELNIPEDEDVYDDGYRSLNISGDNVTFDVNETLEKSPSSGTNVAPDLAHKTPASKGYTLTIGASTLNDDVTYKWLVFAKVTDDDASITAKLIDGTVGDEFASSTDFIDVTLEGVAYRITKNYVAGDGGTYTIEVGAPASGDYYGAQIVIDVDKNYVSKGMSIDPNTSSYTALRALGVNTAGELGFVNNAVLKTSGGEYDAIMDVYEDVVVDVFGMDYFLIGNYVRDSFFEDLTSADTLVATVDIEPWTAYVTVPDNIVVDPPKTGDAASIMGFVMVALSGAGAVALKKRG